MSVIRFRMASKSLIKKGEFSRCTVDFEDVPGSNSAARETSLYVSPNRSKGASTFPPFKTEGSFRVEWRISNIFFNEDIEWNSLGK